MIKQRPVLVLLIFKKIKNKKAKVRKVLDIFEYRAEWLMHVILEFTDVMPWPF